VSDVCSYKTVAITVARDDELRDAERSPPDRYCSAPWHGPCFEVER
jgi:hypothetical protein